MNSPKRTNRTNNTRSIPPNVKKQRRKNTMNQVLNSILDGNLNNNNGLLNQFRKNYSNLEKDERPQADPNNLIFFDKESANPKVYKLSLWNKLKKEYIAYSLLNKYTYNVNENEKYKHYPKMYGCFKLPNNQRYAMLVIEYKEGLKIINKNINSNLYTAAIQFLENAGIEQDEFELDENVQMYLENGKKIFYVFDFELAIFDRNKINELNHNIINKFNSNNQNTIKANRTIRSLF